MIPFDTKVRGASIRILVWVFLINIVFALFAANFAHKNLLPLTPTSVVAIFTNTPKAAATPCQDARFISPDRVNKIDIFFYCGISLSQRDLVLDLVRYDLNSSPPKDDLAANVYVFANYESGARIANRWLQGHRRGRSFELDTLNGERMGITYTDADVTKNAIFIYLNQRRLFTHQNALIGEIVLHEMHHLFQAKQSDFAVGSLKWLVEGGAQVFSKQELSGYGIEPLKGGWPIPCNYSLDMLEYENPNVKNETCYYQQGEEAVNLLLKLFGSEKYPQFLRDLEKESIHNAFLTVFGVPLERFYAVYNEKYSVSIFPAPDAPLPDSRSAECLNVSALDGFSTSCLGRLDDDFLPPGISHDGMVYLIVLHAPNGKFFADDREETIILPSGFSAWILPAEVDTENLFLYIIIPFDSTAGNYKILLDSEIIMRSLLSFIIIEMLRGGDDRA